MWTKNVREKKGPYEDLLIEDSLVLCMLEDLVKYQTIVRMEASLLFSIGLKVLKQLLRIRNYRSNKYSLCLFMFMSYALK